MNLKVWGWLLALSVLWGGSFFFFKVLVDHYPPLTVVLGRVGLAAVLLNLWLWARGENMPRGWRLWSEFLVVGVLNNVVPYTLIVFGETRISSGLASILNATTPIFTVLVAHVWTTNEKLSVAKAFGVAFGFAGVAALVGPGIYELGGDLAGEGACLLAALSYAVAGVYGRRFHDVAPVKVATGQITASTLVLLPVTAFVDRPWTLPAPSVGDVLAWVALAALCTALAYVLYFRILAVAGATNLLLVTFLLPVSALSLGVLLLHETLSARTLAGLALIGMGLAAIDGRPLQSAAVRLGLTRDPKPNPSARVS